MTHLGSRLSALVDGQLSPAAAERALAHVAVCTECSADLRAARATRRALAAAMDVPVAPDLEARLLALRGQACTPPPCPPGERRSVPLPGETDGLGQGRLRGDVVRSRAGAGLLALSGVGVGAVVGVLLVLGEQPEVAPEGHLAHALAVLGQAPTAPPSAAPVDHDAPVRWPAGIDPTAPDAGAAVVAWVADNGWAAPQHLPDGYRVTGLRVDPDGSGSLELDLVGPEGLVVVTQRPGRLDADAVAHLPVEEHDGRVVRVLSGSPWHGVWQQGDVVVDLVASTPGGAPELVAAYPVHEYDDGVGARLTRGWSTLAGAWTP